MNILLLDDHPLFREALKHAIKRQFSDAVVQEAESVASLHVALESGAAFDLLLLDLHVPGAHGFSALVHVRSQWPSLPVIIISGHEESWVMQRAQQHGASAYVPKSAPVEVLAQAMNTVLDGDLWFPSEANKANALPNEEQDIARKVAELTPHQFRVLTMLADGLLNKQIAYELNVTEATVKAHMTAIMKKLEVSNRTQAVVAAAKLQLDPTRLPDNVVEES